MYTIIGGDGREYGPVSAEQVRQWIASGRANAQTKVKAAGTNEWKLIGDFPEFDSAGPAVTLAPAPGIAAPAPPFDPLECFSRGWTLLRANFWSFVGVCGFTFAVGLGLALALRWPSIHFTLTHPGVTPPAQPVAMQLLSQVLSIFLVQPLFGGNLYYILKRARGEPASFGDVFAGFTRAYGSVVLISFVMPILIIVGLICLIIPGIYLGVSYSQALLTVIDRRCGFWTAMELSRRSISRRWWSYLLLLVVGVILLFVGVLALGVGFLVAVPLVYGAMCYAYLDLLPPVIAAESAPV